MKRRQSSLPSPRIWWRLVIVAALVVGVVVLLKCGKPSLSVSHTSTLRLTPTQIKQIRDIGEWEFLTIEDEEVVDTTASGLLSTRELVRLYYGTMRLGINMNEASDDWIAQQGDTLVVVLPPIRLLNDDFIDEARTQTFYEDGSWQPSDHARLYQTARRMMLRRGMTPDNIAAAETAATEQFTQMLRAMGFEQVRVTCSPQPQPTCKNGWERLRQRLQQLKNGY